MAVESDWLPGLKNAGLSAFGVDGWIDQDLGAGSVLVAGAPFGSEVVSFPDAGSVVFSLEEFSDFSSDFDPYFIPDGDLWSVA
jgi:hypothetical protein